jgi:excisionase family DNA binding protein
MSRSSQGQVAVRQASVTRYSKLLDWWQSKPCVATDADAHVLTVRISDPYEVLPADSAGDGNALRHGYLTVKEAAEYADVCELTIRRAYRANQLKVQPVGERGIRIHMKDLLDWMARGGKTKLDVAA